MLWVRKATHLFVWSYPVAVNIAIAVTAEGTVEVGVETHLLLDIIGLYLYAS